MSEKHILTHDGRFTPVSDSWYCNDCGYVWGGYDRTPPYPYCPDCPNPMLRRCK